VPSIRFRVAIIALIAAVISLLVYLQLRHGSRGGGALQDGSNKRPAASSGAVASRGPAQPNTSAAEHAAEIEAALAYLAQSGVPLRPVAGRVTFEGQPVEGATVTLSSALQRLKLAPALQLVTKADGRFDFGPQTALYYTVAASAKGKAPAVVNTRPADLTEKPPSNDLELALGACEVSVFGSIRDNSGGVVADAKVGQDEGAGTRSAADGSYDLCGRTGTFGLSVSADGYGGVRLAISGLGRVQRDVVLVPEGTIVGKVVRAGDGEVVPHAYVSAYPMVWGRERPASGSVMTDVEGRFSVGGMAPGRYRLSAGADGLGFDEQVEVLVEAGHTSPEKTIRLTEQGTVKGRVVAAGKPVVGAAISLTRRAPTAYSGSAVSQEDGTFILKGVPVGESAIDAKPYDVVSPQTLTVPAKGLADVVVEVKPMAAIRGRVLFHGEPVANAPVTDASKDASTVSHPDGTYELKGLKAGEYELSARSNAVGAFVDRVKVTLADGDQKTLDLELVNEGRISGIVVDQQGKPLGGAWVSFNSAKTADGAECGADTSGAFVCTRLRGGEYKADVYLSAESRVRMRPAHSVFPLVALKDNKATAADVRLEVQRDELSISGRVVDASGAPVPDARVDALATETGDQARFDTWTPYPRAITDQNGAFELRGLVGRAYALRARTGTGAEGITKDVAAGRRDVVVTVAKSGTIEGTLVGFTGTPAVYVYKVGLKDGFSPATLQGNRFSIDGLAPGNYVVSASTLAEGETKIVEVRSSQTATLTLTSHGSGRLEGTVTEWGSKRPLADLTCHTVLRDGESIGITDWNQTTAPKTDKQGHFVLDKAPAGDVAVSCFDGKHSTRANAIVTPGQTTTVAMVAAKVDSDAAGSIGVDFNWSGSQPKIEVVYSTGPAAAAGLVAGDVITSLDGVALTGLNSSSVAALIAKREIGTSIRITVLRGSQSVTASVRVASSADHSDGSP